MTIEILTPSPPGDATPAHASTAPEPPKLTLRALVDGVASAVRIGVPNEAWVDAAIVSVRRRKGGFSCELGENDPNPSPNGARLEAFLPDRHLSAIRQSLGLPDFDPVDLEKSSAILRLATSFHPRFHLQAQVKDINPALGDSLLAKHIARIRHNLERDDLLFTQARLPKPPDILRLAVICPEGAAGWADVATELKRLENTGVLSVFAIPPAFEGPSAVPSLVRALGTVRELEKIDLVMIVRGGGASSGLATLANEALARVLCALPIPVVTGIGHASDRGLLDDVAWRAADTPSKALRLVMELIAQPAARARDNWRGIVIQSQSAVVRHSSGLDGLLRSAAANANRRISDARGQLDQLQAELRIAFATKRTELGHQSLAFERLRSELLVAAPQAVELQKAQSRKVLSDGANAVQNSLAALGATMPPPALIGGAVVALLDKEASALESLGERLFAHVASRFNAEAVGLADLEKALRSLSVQDTLARGFVLVTAPNIGATVATATEAAKHHNLILHFSDGLVAVRPEAFSAAPRDNRQEKK